MNFNSCDTVGFYDELFHADGTPRGKFGLLVDRINSLPEGDFQRRQRAAERNQLSSPLSNRKPEIRCKQQALGPI
ncbi:MAG: hypothetical protein OXB91_09460 [Bryobacterales bacterium]|nr:hypothetical protein [Bryobacterales bacterium]